MLALITVTAALASVPTKEIAPGVHMPQVNLGTCCGSLPTVGLGPWLDAGGTGVDTAYDYGKLCPGGKQSDIATILETRQVGQKHCEKSGTWVKRFTHHR